MTDQTHNFSLPAERLSISDVIEQYGKQLNALPDLYEAAVKANAALKSGCSVFGTYGSDPFHDAMRTDARQLEGALLRSAWRHIYAGLHVRKIASADDIKRHDTLLENPPELTMANVREHFGKYIADPWMQVLRALAECFTALDPAFKSHSKVKIGVEGLPKRIIIPNVFHTWSEYGANRVRDVVRVINMLDGSPALEWNDWREIKEIAEKNGECDFTFGLTIKAYQNGNAHLMFSKPLMKRINLCLAEYYGDVLPDAEPDDAPTRGPISTAVAKDLQFYPSSVDVAQTVVYHTDIRSRWNCDDTWRVLEPSCGDGAIIDQLVALRDGKLYENDTRKVPLEITAYDYDQRRIAECRAKGYHPVCANFLEVPPDPTFDVVAMNPPFYGKHYQKHIAHALKFLKPGGKLVCVLPTTAHLDHNMPWTYSWHDLPIGSFAHCGVRVPTGIAVIYRHD